MPDNKHLTLDDRKIIEAGIRNGSTKTAIAKTIGKDNSTVGKEIAQHRILKKKCNLPLECNQYRKCRHGRNCTASCPDYKPFRCNRRDRSPGACNGCSDTSSCRFDHYIYDPVEAQKEYEFELVHSREGINTREEDLIRIGNTIRPLIKQGQSPYAICQNHPEISVSEKTIYNYIESGAFMNVGIDLIPLDLKRQVSRRPMKIKDANQYKIRQDRKHLIGRCYRDYLDYLADHPYAKIVQMDTVYNDRTNGPFMQTFKFLSYSFMVVLFHSQKTSLEMYEGILYLESILGEELFHSEVEIIVTDRGGEFMMAEETEMHEDGKRRTRLFYCDPMAPGQKGSLEVYHSLIRSICPKETDLYALGLTCQAAANSIASNINSYPEESLHGKTPWNYMGFMNPDLLECFQKGGLEYIEPDKVNLTPSLLKPFRV